MCNSPRISTSSPITKSKPCRSTSLRKLCQMSPLYISVWAFSDPFGLMFGSLKSYGILTQICANDVLNAALVHIASLVQNCCSSALAAWENDWSSAVLSNWPCASVEDASDRTLTLECCDTSVPSLVLRVPFHRDKQQGHDPPMSLAKDLLDLPSKDQKEPQLPLGCTEDECWIWIHLLSLLPKYAPK